MRRTGGLSLYILGFALGPLLLGPISCVHANLPVSAPVSDAPSEYVGRRPVYLVSWAIFTIFQIPMAVAQNVRIARSETLLIVADPHRTRDPLHPRPERKHAAREHWRQRARRVQARRVRSGDGNLCALACSVCDLTLADTLSSVIGPPFGNAMCGFIAQEVRIAATRACN